ncbi:AI-2E family transporter [Planomicrobium sp. CPCC 101110]|uniref:AI-2E family transporter n=1 Tax=Planomicrobium sp. CPCC 101110 TaxID=2599619 RepID=UPI0011B412B7|nr:AI-2E family transporter [Planomicrobium sp. CPCC 101110]TWT24747.1 AI-2E family transporter [Planomicrobium sp. CPCC 101110]
MWIRKPFFEYATAILFAVVILFFLGRIDYVWIPFKIIIATIFAPILIAGLLYYMIRPFLRLLMRYMPKNAGIVILFMLMVLVITTLVYYFGPLIKSQVEGLAELAPERVEEVTEESGEALSQIQFGGVSGTELKNQALGHIKNLSDGLMENVLGIFTMVMNVALVLIIVPFILFFLLRDDEKLVPHLMKYLSEDRRPEGRKVLKDADQALSTYIVSQVIVAVVVGVLMYIGYVIIGLEYALTLAVFAMFLNIVPFLGPMIGVVPALFVALISPEPFMALKVLAVLFVVQQLEGNLVTPNVMGSRLNIHPLTIILLLLVSAALYGFIGLLIAIPSYAVLKTLVHNFRLFMRLRRKREIANGVNSDS